MKGKLKWKRAEKVLPPMGAVVLVKDPDEKYDYVVCTLAAKSDEEMFEFVFFPYSDHVGSSIEIKEGTLWARINLPDT